ncbi:MAG: DUF4255 domain-containing protein [Paludibacteraceae bacterium]|nr:DUF4255 domain-containing protein [Paludibacteraceae bacterium]
MYTTLYLIKEYLKNCFQYKETGRNNLGYVNVSLAPIEKDGQKEGEDIVITLLRVEEETSRKPQNVFQYGIDAQDGKRKAISKKRNPDVCLNLYVLISSHAQIYETAIAQISDVVYWMNSIDYEMNSDEISGKHLRVELQSLTAEQHNSMWQTLGGKMVPSVVYKVRMVTISSEPSTQPVYQVSSLSLTGNSGPWSRLLVKLHAGEKLSEEEGDDLRREMVVRYAYPRMGMDLEIVDEKDDSEELKRRKDMLRQWMREETWHLSEIDRKDLSGEFVFPTRIRDVKHQQLNSLIAALKEIYKKSPEERTPTETQALNRALKDAEIKEDIQKI